MIVIHFKNGRTLRVRPGEKFVVVSNGNQELAARLDPKGDGLSSVRFDEIVAVTSDGKTS